MRRSHMLRPVRTLIRGRKNGPSAILHRVVTTKTTLLYSRRAAQETSLVGIIPGLSRARVYPPSCIDPALFAPTHIIARSIPSSPPCTLSALASALQNIAQTHTRTQLARRVDLTTRPYPPNPYVTSPRPRSTSAQYSTSEAPLSNPYQPP
ncbi:hypothetical protein BC629DRAFT_884376 [Irpex lacteus]|nr:hypothetical protein BC629DRAFT_884376 [Irpex lacteus]